MADRGQLLMKTKGATCEPDADGSQRLEVLVCNDNPACCTVLMVKDNSAVWAEIHLDEQAVRQLSLAAAARVRDFAPVAP